MATDENQGFSFQALFIPFTTLKGVQWIIVIGCVVFANMLLNNFVWDDVSYVSKNPEVHQINIPLFFQQSSFSNQGQYRPLTEIYYAIMYSIFSTNAFFYHCIQLLLHVLVVILVFLLLKKFFRPFLAFLLSVIFLVHPMQVESVSYIGTTVNIGVLLFGLIILFLVERKNQTILIWVAIVLLMLLGFLIKESGLQIVLIAIVYSAFFYRKQLVGISLAASISFLSYLFIRLSIGHVYFESRPLVPIASIGFMSRIFNIPSILLYYFKTFVFPIHLVVDQQWYFIHPTIISFLLPLGILCAIFIPISIYTIMSISKRKKAGLVFLFFLLWTIVGFGMYSQLVPLDMTVADWWMYFPMVGVLGLTGCCIEYIQSIQEYRKLLYGFLIVAILLFSIRTIVRNTNWVDSVTLFSHDIKYDTNYITENDYAAFLTDIGDYPNALIHQKKSVDLFPYEFNILNIGRIYQLSGHLHEAEKYYSLALQIKSPYTWNQKSKHIIFTYTHLARVLILEGKTENALPVIHAGLQDYMYDTSFSQTSDLLLCLALADYQIGKYTDALTVAKKIYSIAPNSTTAKRLYTQLLVSKKINVQEYLAILPL